MEQKQRYFQRFQEALSSLEEVHFSFTWLQLPLTGQELKEIYFSLKVKEKNHGRYFVQI